MSTEKNEDSQEVVQLDPQFLAIDMLYHCMFEAVLLPEKLDDFYESLAAVTSGSSTGELFIQLYFANTEAELAQDDKHINYVALHYNFLWDGDDSLGLECIEMLLPEDGRSDIDHDSDYAQIPSIVLQLKDLNLEAAAAHVPHTHP